MNAVHFVGFIHPEQGKDARYHRAVAVFGEPDMVHRIWDMRAVQEIAPGDVVVFAKGTERDAPSVFSFDDSAVMADPRVVGPEEDCD